MVGENCLSTVGRSLSEHQSHGGPEPLPDAATALEALQGMVDELRAPGRPRRVIMVAVQAPPELRSRLV
jgi:hypothetical protein